MNSLLTSLLGSPRNNLTATVAPTTSDNYLLGYSAQSLWYNVSSMRVYLLVNATTGLWADLTSVAIVGGFKGFWDASVNSPTLADGTGSNGDFYYVSTPGTQDLGSGSQTFANGDQVIYDGSIWTKIPAINIISSVFGRVGAIVAANGDYTASQVTNVAAGNIAAITVQDAIDELDGQDTTIAGALSDHIGDVLNPHAVTQTQVGLGNVDNTSDADKPISDDTQSALDLKQDILAEGAFIDGDKTKLDGIEALADVTDNTNVLAAIGYTPEDAANKDVTGGYTGLTALKINFKNALDTFTSFFTNANTAARTYTFQDRDGTIADDTDLALKLDLAGGTVDELIVGDPGTEGSGINIGGVNYESTVKVSDIAGTNFAQNIIHRHSTTLEPLILGARTNSDTTAHADITAGQNVFSIYGAGYAGSNYKLFGSVTIGADSTGTISNTSAPGRMIFNITPDASILPAAWLTVTNDKKATFAGTINNTALTASELVATDASKNLVSLPVATYPSLAELAYGKGVTSAIQDQLDGKVAKSLFDANTILAATTDDTPAALTVAASTFVGRKSTGDISAMSVAEAKTELAYVAADFINDATSTSTNIYSASKTDSQIATAVTGVFSYRGVIDCSIEPDYPAAFVGDVYKVSVAGKIGGSSGLVVEIGDSIYCNTDSPGGTEASVGGEFNITQANIDIAALAGNGLVVNGSALDVNVDDSTIEIATDVVQLKDAGTTLAKIANASANSKLLGSGASGSGAAYAELTLGTNLSMSGTTLNAAGGGGAIAANVIPTGLVNGSNVTFTLPTTPSGDILLYASGVRLLPTADYSITGDTITMVTAPATGTVIFADYDIGSGVAGDLVAANNLSDVDSASTSRTNLGAAASGANSDITSLNTLSVKTSGSAYFMPIVPNDAFTADRTLNIKLFDADRTLTLKGEVTFNGNTEVSTYANTYLASANESSFKSAVNLEIGVDVQAYDANTAKLDVAQSFTKAQGTTPATLTSTSNAIAVDASLSNKFVHGLTEDTTVSAPSNLVDGRSYTFTFKQDATPRTLAFDAAFLFMNDQDSTMPTTENSTMKVCCDYTTLGGLECTVIKRTV